MTFGQSIVAAWMQMAVLSSKNAECITLLPLLQNKRETSVLNFSTVHLVLCHGKRGSYWRRAEIQSHHMNSVLHICTEICV